MSTNSGKNSFRLLKYGCLFVGGLSLCLIIGFIVLFAYAHRTLALLEPFPDYPNSIRIVSKDNNFSFICTEAFRGEKYAILATTDSTDQVLEFYNGIASKQNLELHGGANIGKGSDISKVSCFEPGKSTAYERPTNIVIALNPHNPDTIEKFTNMPANTKVVIILIHGYTIYV